MADLSPQSIALALGVSAILSASCRRLRIPALLPLLAAGIALGVSGVGLIDGDSLGPALKGFITAAIGLLIFEGALHLTREDLARAPRAVWGLLTVGTAATWIFTSLAAHLFLDFPWPVAILLGATLIVTGPTVVQPIIRRLDVSARVKTVLSAEAILIDPIGVLATVATLEVVRLSLHSGFDPALAQAAAGRFFIPLLGGAAIGAVLGLFGFLLLRTLGRRQRTDPQILNLIGVGFCMGSVGAGEALAPEAGLAAVTLTGVVMARARILGATEMRAFKELLATLLVGTLFILLASRFDIDRIRTLTRGDAAFVLALLFLVRPLGVALAAWGSSLNLRERTFIALFAPRGIVALSVATLAAGELIPALPPDHPLTHAAQRLDLVMFTVIAGSVLFACLGAPLLSLLLRIRGGEGGTLVLIGAHPLSLSLATLLRSLGVNSRIIDSSLPRVELARAQGLDALRGDATDARWLDDAGAPHDAGALLAWTGNHDVDALAARWGADRFGASRARAWAGTDRSDLPAIPASAAHPLAILLDLTRQNRLVTAHADRPDNFAVLLGTVRRATFTPAGETTPAPAKDIVFIGLERIEHDSPPRP